ncbi:hypothetical protein [Clostridium minihomine]|uniref:hypothetical protein n=1 Tax=Clostridium minihomine TaxID=2045012 RepID=UPI000C76CCD4|nr:hypothetical protein [Clostridium minihomine]
MKRKLSLLLAFSLLMVLCACSQQAANAPKEQLDGYLTYESTSPNIKLQYPPTWLAVHSEGENDSEALKSIYEKSGISEDTIEQSLSLYDFVLFDSELALQDCASNLNLISVEMPGFQASSLKGKEVLDSMKEQTAFARALDGEDFAFVSEPENKTIAGNLYVIYQFNYTKSDIPLSIYQAITAFDETIYTFTYTTRQGSLDDAKLTEINNVLSSIQFTNA